MEETPLRFEIECSGNEIKVKTNLPTSHENAVTGLAYLLQMMKNNELAELINKTFETSDEYSAEQNKILQSLRAVIVLNKFMNSGARPFHPSKVWERMNRGI